MVSEKKKEMLVDVKKRLKEYPVIGILDMHKLPGRQLHEIRKKLRGEAVIYMLKKRVMTRALDQSDSSGIKDLLVHISGEPALLLSKTDPFKLARKIEKSKSKARAKGGDISPEDILIKAGPTPLPPGPVIGELQKVKLPAGVQGDKIHVMKDTVIVKEGEEISNDVAGVLTKLGIEPMEIGLTLKAAWESGIVYPAEIMFVPLSEYVKQVEDAGSAAFNLSININLFTPDTVSFLIAKAGMEANSLAINADIITPDTLGIILSKANVHADVIAGMVKEAPAEPPEEKPAEKAKEEKAEEQKAEEPAKEDKKEGKNREKPKE